MRSYLHPVLLALTVVALSGCEGPYFANAFEPAPAPDYRIKVTTGPDGLPVALPPDCPDWHSSYRGALQNEPWPQYGCANARNLAAMVERPDDLIEGRDPGPASGHMAAFAMKRYEAGKTIPLIDPNAKAPVQNTTVIAPSGEKGGGGEGGASQQ